MLERIVPHRVRNLLLAICTGLIIFFLVVCWDFASAYPALWGLLFLSLAVLLKLIALEAFYYSHRFDERVREPYLFELAMIVGQIGTQDTLGDFIGSHEGGLILTRAGFRTDALAAYRAEHVVRIPLRAVSFPHTDDLFASFVRGIYRADAAFEHLLIAQGISEDDLVEAAFFAMHMDRVREDSKRWWHTEDEVAELAIRMMHTILQFERQTGMHMSHPAFVTMHGLISEDELSRELMEEIFSASAENALLNNRIIILAQDMVQG